MSVNILFEQLRKPNAYPASSDFYLENYYCPRYRTILPLEFHQMDDLKIVSLDDLNNVDYFVYPIIVNEPFYVIRELLDLEHPYGLFHRIHPDVMHKINLGKGKIFVSLNAEPVNDDELTQLQQIKDSRIVYNIVTSKYFVEDHMTTFPGWMELTEFSRDIAYSRWNTLIFNDAKPAFVANEKRKFCLINGRWEKHAAAMIITHLLDKSDLLKYGFSYVDHKGATITKDYNDLKNQFSDNSKLKKFVMPSLKHQKDIEANPLIISQVMQNSFFNIAIEAYYVNYQIDYPYLTEKTWRNFNCRMPFVLIGQKHTLKQLHELGYKTFHPFIDESYDDRSDDYRVFEAFRQIAKLCAKSHEELADLVTELQPIFDHNFKNHQLRKNEFSKYVRSLKVR